MQELNEDTIATLLTCFLHRAAFPFLRVRTIITIKKYAYLISNGFIKQFSAQFLVLENSLTSHGTYLLWGKRLQMSSSHSHVKWDDSVKNDNSVIY